MAEDDGPMTNRHWTHANDRTLLECFPMKREWVQSPQEVEGLQRAAEKLGRSYKACLDRWYKLRRDTYGPMYKRKSSSSKDDGEVKDDEDMKALFASFAELENRQNQFERSLISIREAIAHIDTASTGGIWDALRDLTERVERLESEYAQTIGLEAEIDELRQEAGAALKELSGRISQNGSQAEAPKRPTLSDLIR